MKKVLTIAGSDSSGGAGIQADLKTFENLGVWGLSVITSLTSQNTQGVIDSIPIHSDFVYKQIESVVLDINIDAVKIGMLFSKDNVKVVSKAIEKFKLKNVVVDTVFISKNGKPLLEKEGINIMKDYLFPLSSIITPNILEAEILTDKRIKSVDDMKEACIKLTEYGVKTVLLKGGHLENSDFAIDILLFNNQFYEFKYTYIKGIHPKGTGCTLSSAIASFLAKGYDIKKSVNLAKLYISGAIETAKSIGKGYPVLNFKFPKDYHK